MRTRSLIYSYDFDLNVWFWACKVTWTFEKQAPEKRTNNKVNPKMGLPLGLKPGHILSQLCHPYSPLPLPTPLSLPHKQSFVVSNFLSFFFYRCSSDMYCWEKLLWIVSFEWHQSNWPHQNWLLGVNKRQNMLVFYYLQSYSNSNRPFAWLRDFVIINL